MSAAAPSPRAGYRVLLTLAALVVVVAGLRLSAELLLPLLLAVFLAILAAPPTLWLERRRVPAPLAVAIVIVGVVVGLAGFLALLVSSLSAFREAAPRYQARIAEGLEGLDRALHRFGLEISAESLLGVVEPGSILQLVSSMLGGLVAAAVNTSLVVLLLVFILLEAAGFPRKLRAAMGDPHADLSRYAAAMAEIQRYLAIKTLVSVATGLAIFVWTWTLGLDFPMLWGLVAFLFNYVPNVGSILAAVPAMVVAVLQLGIGGLVGTGIGYLVVNTVFGNIVEPHLMGRSLGLSPLVVFLSLVVWGWIWGPVGMLLSVPLTMVAKIVLERTDDLRWIAVLLGPAPPADPDASASMVARIVGAARRRGAGRKGRVPPAGDDGPAA